MQIVKLNIIKNMNLLLEIVLIVAKTTNFEQEFHIPIQLFYVNLRWYN